MVLYLIGLSHNAQVRKQGSPETDLQEEFAGCLRRSVRTVHPAFIAEEWSDEQVVEQSVVSITKEIADEDGIAHKFCDPNSDERVSRGYRGYVSIFHSLLWSNDEGLPEDELHIRAQAIEVGRYFPIRERFWLDQLSKFTGRDGIFVCGQGHIDSFTELLGTRQIQWEILAEKVGLTAQEDAQVQAVEGYLTKHPELANWNN